MTRQETSGSGPIGVPIGSRKWTPEQLERWLMTGETPRRKPTPIPRELRIAVWHRDDGVCGLCGDPADPLDWACDHIMPNALDGPTILDNLRVTHPRCNRTRTDPRLMSDAEIDDAAHEWTENEIRRTWPTFAEFLADPDAAIAKLEASGTADAETIAALRELAAGEGSSTTLYPVML